MAWVYCPQCKNTISDDVGNCPYCGIGIIPISQSQPQQAANTVTAQNPPRQLPRKFIIIGAAAAAVILVLLTVLIVMAVTGGSSKPTGITVGSYNTNGANPSAKTYTVNLIVDCHYNKVVMWQRDDIDISIDGEKIDTLAHGSHGEYALTLEEGSHRIFFNKSGASSVWVDANLSVTGNATVSYLVTCKSDGTLTAVRQ